MDPMGFANPIAAGSKGQPWHGSTWAPTQRFEAVQAVKLCAPLLWVQSTKRNKEEQPDLPMLRNITVYKWILYISYNIIYMPLHEHQLIFQVFQNYSFDRAMLLKHNCDVAGSPRGSGSGFVDHRESMRIHENPVLPRGHSVALCSLFSWRTLFVVVHVGFIKPETTDAFRHVELAWYRWYL